MGIERVWLDERMTCIGVGGRVGGKGGQRREELLFVREAQVGAYVEGVDIKAAGGGFGDPAEGRAGRVLVARRLFLGRRGPHVLVARGMFLWRGGLHVLVAAGELGDGSGGGHGLVGEIILKLRGEDADAEGGSEDAGGRGGKGRGVIARALGLGGGRQRPSVLAVREGEVSDAAGRAVLFGPLINGFEDGGLKDAEVDREFLVGFINSKVAGAQGKRVGRRSHDGGIGL